MSLAVVIVVGSIVHAMLIEGTMETMSKAALCALVLAAAIKVMVDLVKKMRATALERVSRGGKRIGLEGACRPPKRARHRVIVLTSTASQAARRARAAQTSERARSLTRARWLLSCYYPSRGMRCAVNKNFYDELAESFHLIFDDWDAAIVRQRDVLARLLPPPYDGNRVLDCACGIGTQAIGLAMLGFCVEGSDLSPAAIDRARRETTMRGLKAEFRVDDMRSLSTAPIHSYDALIAMDNALPHLESDEDIKKALVAMRTRLRRGGVALVSLRDYGPLMAQRVSQTPPSLYRDGQLRRFVHQVWDWQDERRYILHLFVTAEQTDGWQTRHFVGHYRAVPPSEVAALARDAGFDDVRVLAPEDSGYYQPVIRAVAP
jgi:2-polyprenyl-3-methyl-5-hydroxy-6-metoxy-1,4-benzoquinol methylase